MRDDRSVLDLLNARYTFVNAKLARLYGIPNIRGLEMRKASGWRNTSAAPNAPHATREWIRWASAWRTSTPLAAGGRVPPARPIDATGVLPDGTRFDGPGELRDVLLRRKSEFLYNFSRKMLGYALGRSLNRLDECLIKDGVRAMEANDDTPGALLETIVLSAPFQYRFSKK